MDVPIKKSLYQGVTDDEMARQYLRAVDRDLQNIFLFTADSSLNITEADGLPNVKNTKKIIFTNGTVTDNGNGSVTVNTSGGAGGETNTASNTGTAGTGIYKQKSSVDLEFYKLNSVNNKLTIGLDGTDKVDLTINESNIDHGNLTGLSTGADHSYIDQDVTSASTPTFTGTNFTGIPYTGLSDGTDGELITWAADGTIDTVAVGTATHVLTSNGVGVAPTFQAASSGFTDPMTTRGDVIVRNSSNTTARLAIGTSAQVLTSDGTDISWSAASSGGVTVKTGSFTRDVSTASGTQDVTGLGLTPAALHLTMSHQSSEDSASWGLSDGTNNRCIYTNGTNYERETTTAVVYDDGAGGAYFGDVTATASGQFTITWTKYGSPTGTIEIQYMVYE